VTERKREGRGAGLGWGERMGRLRVWAGGERERGRGALLLGLPGRNRREEKDLFLLLFFFLLKPFQNNSKDQFENILTFPKITQHKENKCSNMNAQQVATPYDKF
jgi:hypothetical protein